jgi:hypothetical protein
MKNTIKVSFTVREIELISPPGLVKMKLARDFSKPSKPTVGFELVEPVVKDDEQTMAALIKGLGAAVNQAFQKSFGPLLASDNPTETTLVILKDEYDKLGIKVGDVLLIGIETVERGETD